MMLSEFDSQDIAIAIATGHQPVFVKLPPVKSKAGILLTDEIWWLTHISDQRLVH